MFSGKSALVTGGGSGIGAATAQAFARLGARVAVCDIAIDAAQAIADSIVAAGGDAFALAADVAATDSVAAMMRAVEDRFGGLDIAVNNAGIGGSGSLLTDVPEDHFDRVMAVNLKGVWQCMRHEIPLMLRNGGGVIVNTASALGMVARVNSSEYIAAKHAVVGMTKAAALEYSASGIRVNAVCPGVIVTLLVESAMANPAIAADLLALHPIGRLGRVDEVADAIVWLASPQSSFVTGIALPVDGGWTAH